MARDLLLIVAVVLGLTTVEAGVVGAWKFNMGGVLKYQYEQAFQMGSNGFFGPYDVDAGTTTAGDFAPLNGWLGARMVSGASAGNTFIFLYAAPSLDLNEAVKFTGGYLVGPYFTDTAPGQAVISQGQWINLSVKLKTPLGNVSYGKRSFGHGCGLQFRNGRTEEYLALEVCRLGWDERTTYGALLHNATGISAAQFNPLTEQTKLAIAEENAESLDDLKGWAANPGVPVHLYSPNLTFGLGLMPWRRGSTAYWNRDDMNSARTVDFFGYVNYLAANLGLGFGGLYSSFHEGPESQQTVQTRRTFLSRDTRIFEGWVYCKYNNGRYFLNCEADWFNKIIRYQRSFSRASRRPDYNESWRYMVESGFLFGPLKFTALYVFMPGPDRRHGIRIDRQPFVQDAQRAATGVFSPYSALLADTYSSGVNSFADLADASTIAVRFDYALAANLNLYFSLLKATRVSHGYGWGYIRPNPAGPFGTVEFALQGDFANPSPAIPDNDLGYELNLGMDWRILGQPRQDWVIRLVAGYWRPGRWFNYACVDKSRPGWDNPAVGNDFGVIPDRTIDPVGSITLIFEGGF